MENNFAKYLSEHFPWVPLGDYHLIHETCTSPYFELEYYVAKMIKDFSRNHRGEIFLCVSATFPDIICDTLNVRKGAGFRDIPKNAFNSMDVIHRNKERISRLLKLLKLCQLAKGM